MYKGTLIVLLLSCFALGYEQNISDSLFTDAIRVTNLTTADTASIVAVWKNGALQAVRSDSLIKELSVQDSVRAAYKADTSNVSALSWNSYKWGGMDTVPDGTNGQVLTTDGARNWFFSDKAGGTAGTIESINGSSSAAQTILGDNGLTVVDSGTGNFQHKIRPASGRIIPTGSGDKVDSSQYSYSTKDHHHLIDSITGLQSKLDSLIDTTNYYKDHAHLNNINSAPYWHPTQTQHTDLTDGGETTLHGHVISKITGLNDTITKHRDTINELKTLRTSKQNIDSDLSSLAALSTTGLLVRAATGSVVTRSMATSGNGITVSNGDGVSGNPTVALTYGTTANTACQGNDPRLDTSTIGDRFVRVRGDTMQGDLTFKTPTEYAAVTDLGVSSPIEIPDFRTTTNNMFVPFLHTSTRIQGGYKKHLSVGSYRTGSGWSGGMYFAQGDNDNYPTEYFLMNYGGSLYHVNGSGLVSTFWSTENLDTSVFSRDGEVALKLDKAAIDDTLPNYNKSGAGKIVKGLGNGRDTSSIISDDGSTVTIGVSSIAELERVKLYCGPSGATKHAFSRFTIEDDTYAAFQFLTPNTFKQYIMFGDPEKSNMGQIAYNHATDKMTMDIDGNEELIIGGDGISIADTTKSRVMQSSSLTASKALATDANKNIISVNYIDSAQKAVLADSVKKSLAISKITGLQTALDNKLGLHSKADRTDTLGTHRYTYYDTVGHGLIETRIGQKLTIGDTADLARTSELSAYQPLIFGAASSVTTADLFADRVATTNSSGKISSSFAITTTELGFLDGATTNIPSEIYRLNDSVALMTRKTELTGGELDIKIDSTYTRALNLYESTCVCTLKTTEFGWEGIGPATKQIVGNHITIRIGEITYDKYENQFDGEGITYIEFPTGFLPSLRNGETAYGPTVGITSTNNTFGTKYRQVYIKNNIRLIIEFSAGQNLIAEYQSTTQAFIIDYFK
jgi:hypothetical protein